MNSKLTLQMLANVACVAGVDVGFNAALAVKHYGRGEDKINISFMFGDRAKLPRTLISYGDAWALAEYADAECMREPRQLTFSEGELNVLSTRDICSKITAMLLELVP